MMRACYVIPLLIAAFTLTSGCSRLALMTSDDVPTLISEAQARQDFNAAWFYLENTRDTHPQYDAVMAMRPSLEKETRNFESSSIQRATDLAAAGRWQEAFDALDDAKRLWRRSNALEDAGNALVRRETALFQRLQSSLLVDEATWLGNHLNTLKQLKTLNRQDADALSQALMQRREELVETLTELGNVFAGQEDWVRTRDVLAAAHSLSGNDTPPDALVHARKQLSLEATRHRRAREDQVQSKARALLDAYDTSLSLRDLLSARDYISHNNPNGLLDPYASRLEAICQQRYQSGMQQGDALYAQGRYEDALRMWESIMPIYPGDTELDKKMERARKVLSTLKALSDS